MKTLQTNDFYKEMFDAVFLDKKRNQRSETHYLSSSCFPQKESGLAAPPVRGFIPIPSWRRNLQRCSVAVEKLSIWQYQFIIDDQQLVFPVSTAKSDFLTTVRQDSEANQESSVSYSVENWNEVEEKTGIPLLTSALLQSKIEGSDSAVNLTAYTGENDTVEKIEATALFSDSDKNGKAYTVLFSAGTYFTEQAFDLNSAKGNSRRF